MLNVVTIGTSFITDLFLQAVEQLEGIRCTGMYTRTRDHALALAQRHGVCAIYTDLDEMLAADADIVYIASPNALHAEHAEKALRAGKHVICEKPFTMTSAQARALFQLAEQKQRFLFEAIVTQHMPNYHAIRDLLPRIGKIKVVQSNFSQYSSRYAQYLSGSVPNVFSPQWGGGALADIGIYCIHFIVGLFNELFGITEIRTNDLRYNVEGKDGKLTTQRFWGKSKVSFLASYNGLQNFGVGLWGVTPEEEQFGPWTAKSAEQFVTLTQWTEPDPTAVWSKASGLFVPVLPNPAGLFIATAKLQ